MARPEDDIKILRGPDGVTMSILIRGSKNDHEKLGAARVLRANDSDMCPVRAAIAFMEHRQSVKDSSEWFPSAFRGRIADATKWDAVAKNISTDVVSTHSLRAGGIRPSSPQGWTGSLPAAGVVLGV